MSDDLSNENAMITVASSRFGDLTVPEDSVIDFPSGLIGFPRAQRFIMVEQKQPFCWLQSIDDPGLAFVVVDGYEFGDNYTIEAPVGDKDTDLKEDDEYAILVIVTVRQDPTLTTANLKAPLIVNLRNKSGVQVIFDNPSYSTRYPIYSELESEDATGGQQAETEGPKKDGK